MLKYDVIKPAVRSTKLPIIMLHGFYDDRGGLSEIAKSPLISADRTCYLLDLRNHGQSPWAKDMHFEVRSLALFLCQSLNSETSITQ